VAEEDGGEEEGDSYAVIIGPISKRASQPGEEETDEGTRIDGFHGMIQPDLWEGSLRAN
jgi:hypothetical protein